MRVCGVEVDRFLCFRRLAIDVDNELQLVAGPNNAGKSSLVRLIETFFSDPRGEDLVRLLPLHAYYDSLGPRTLSRIQLWFNDFTAAESELFGSIIRRNDQSMSIAVRCTRRGQISYQASRGVTADESRRRYEEVLERFSFVKIPSVRVGGAGDSEGPDSLERLLDTLEAVLIRGGSSRSTALQADFSSRVSGMEELVRDVLDESAAAISADLPFQEGDVKFQLPDPRFALRGMLEAAVIESHGDARVPVASRGTGFQSALVLGILRYVASRNSADGVNGLFAIEEPEAFLHPQTQRAMAKIIKAISQDAQVLVTTHSPVLVDSFELKRIARIPLQTGGTDHIWSAPQLEPADEGRLTRYCSAANSELVFANAVVFVEGEGDYAVVEKLLGRACDAPGGHYARGVSVINAGGIGKIKHLVALAELFGVRSYVLVDKDGVHSRDGTRVLLTILAERRDTPDPTATAAIGASADAHCSTLTEALSRQADVNVLLNPYDAFILSSDLEGIFLDSYGVQGLVESLGPTGEAVIDEAFAVQLVNGADGYEDLAKWLGSKGWNSDRTTSKKLEPHLAPLLIERWFGAYPDPAAPMEALCAWLDQILQNASPTPV